MGTGGRRRTMVEIETAGNSILQGSLYWLDSKTGMLGKLFGITIISFCSSGGRKLLNGVHLFRIKRDIMFDVGHGE